MHDCIQHAADKGNISPNIADRYDAVFAKCADWFAPSNKKGDEFTLAMNLHNIGLLDCKKESRGLLMGGFSGYHITFKQSKGVTPCNV